MNQLPPAPEELLEKITVLPPEQRQQVLDFVDFLAQKYVHAQSDATSRMMGLYEGMGYVSEDFDEPLLEKFCLGES